MKVATKRITSREREQIDAAVAEAEALTSAEIVPVVATTSGRYERGEDIVGLWVGAAALVLVWLFLPQESGESGSWGGVSAAVKLGLLLAALACGFVVGASLAARVGWLKRLFVPRRQMRDKVNARAREVFFDRRVYRTGGGTGVLVYVSLLERRAALLADQNVVDKLGQPAIDELCGQLTGELRKHRCLAEALCATIKTAGERLAAALPKTGNDTDELPNALVTID
jgi:putative membrane protein